MRNRNKLISLAPRRPKPVWRHMPSLKEFWEELQRCQTGCDVPSSMRAGSGRGSAHGSGRLSGSGSARGSGSSRRYGSGSASGEDCGGYGIDLVLPDGDAQERIMKIMRELCAKDAARQSEAADH